MSHMGIYGYLVTQLSHTIHQSVPLFFCHFRNGVPAFSPVLGGIYRYF